MRNKDKGDPDPLLDRIALFNEGRIEQVGSPSEIYEHPASAFVAGFVGTSNLISGDLAQRVTGKKSTFSIRPEKIHMEKEDANAPSDSYSADGVFRDVIYLGLLTRYFVKLDGGGEVVVIEQNLKTTSMDVLKIKGQRTRLHWKKEHTHKVGD